MEQAVELTREAFRLKLDGKSLTRDVLCYTWERMEDEDFLDRAGVATVQGILSCDPDLLAE